MIVTSSCAITCVEFLMRMTSAIVSVDAGICFPYYYHSKECDPNDFFRGDNLYTDESIITVVISFYTLRLLTLKHRSTNGRGSISIRSEYRSLSDTTLRALRLYADPR